MDIQQYLKPTGIVDSDSEEIKQAVSEITKGTETKGEAAIRIFHFVRDEVKFGFTKEFDMAKASYTLGQKVGHCNPKATLFVALCRAVDIAAKFHFVTISKEILRGVFPAFVYPFVGKNINHSFAEIFIDDRWIKLDSYVIDKKLYENSLIKLRQKGQDVGFGIHIDGNPEWNGEDDTFVQFVHKEVIAPKMDHGTYADPASFYESDKYVNKMNAFRRFMWESHGAYKEINNQLEKIRRG